VVRGRSHFTKRRGASLEAVASRLVHGRLSTERVGLSLDVLCTSALCVYAMPLRFALARVAVELKFSSHGKFISSAGAEHRCVLDEVRMYFEQNPDED
jgi:hypothetical protein